MPMASAAFVPTSTLSAILLYRPKPTRASEIKVGEIEPCIVDPRALGTIHAGSGKILSAATSYPEPARVGHHRPLEL